MVVREKKGGKFIRVTEAMARAKLGKGEEIIEVWEKDPSIHAFTNLMNRALDKPKEQELPVSLQVEGDIVARLHFPPFFSRTTKYLILHQGGRDTTAPRQ